MFSLSLFVLPLFAAASGSVGDVDRVDVAQQIEQFAPGVREGFINVGVGIGSIFILFVIFYYVTAILEGGKFQTKMLWPVVIYLLVANFTIVSKATLSFTGIFRGSASESAWSKEGYTSILDKYASMLHNEKDESTKRLDELAEKAAGLDSSNIIDDSTSPADSTDQVRGSWIREAFNSLGQNIVQGINAAWRSIKVACLRHIIPGEKENADALATEMADSFIPFVLCILMDLLASALGKCMVIFGTIMTHILIAFGPITWSFAIFPGNGKVIGSWFIRICQFALYGPIANLVCAFSVNLIGQMHVTAQTDGLIHGFASISMLLVALICSIITLMNVPSISQMIIEGASGTVSMMAGVGTLASVIDLGHDMKQTNMLEGMTGKGGSGGSNGNSNSGGGSGGGGGSSTNRTTGTNTAGNNG